MWDTLKVGDYITLEDDRSILYKVYKVNKTHVWIITETRLIAKVSKIHIRYLVINHLDTEFIYEHKNYMQRM